MSTEVAAGKKMSRQRRKESLKWCKGFKSISEQEAREVGRLCYKGTVVDAIAMSPDRPDIWDQTTPAALSTLTYPKQLFTWNHQKRTKSTLTVSVHKSSWLWWQTLSSSSFSSSHLFAWSFLIIAGITTAPIQGLFCCERRRMLRSRFSHSRFPPFVT